MRGASRRPAAAVYRHDERGGLDGVGDARSYVPRGVVPVRARHFRAAVVFRRYRRGEQARRARQGRQLFGAFEQSGHARFRQDGHRHEGQLRGGRGYGRARSRACRGGARGAVFRAPDSAVGRRGGGSGRTYFRRRRQRGGDSRARRDSDGRRRGDRLRQRLAHGGARHSV